MAVSPAHEGTLRWIHREANLGILGFFRNVRSGHAAVAAEIQDRWPAAGSGSARWRRAHPPSLCPHALGGAPRHISFDRGAFARGVNARVSGGPSASRRIALTFPPVHSVSRLGGRADSLPRDSARIDADSGCAATLRPPARWIRGGPAAVWSRVRSRPQHLHFGGGGRCCRGPLPLLFALRFDSPFTATILAHP